MWRVWSGRSNIHGKDVQAARGIWTCIGFEFSYSFSFADYYVPGVRHLSPVGSSPLGEGFAARRLYSFSVIGMIGSDITADHTLMHPSPAFRVISKSLIDDCRIGTILITFSSSCLGKGVLGRYLQLKIIDDLLPLLGAGFRGGRLVLNIAYLYCSTLKCILIVN